MGRFNWGRDGPPDDAYSRVTEPERFAPLHGWALEAVARLQTEYEVTLDEDGVTDADLERSPLSRPLMKLTPIQDSSPPITIAFTDFPGLGVRMGRLLQRLGAKAGLQRVGQPPGHHVPAVPVHDGHQIEEAPGHGQVGDVRRPHPIGPGDPGLPQQVRKDFGPRSWPTGARLPVDGP